jgi:flagellar FliL protein
MSEVNEVNFSKGGKMAEGGGGGGGGVVRKLGGLIRKIVTGLIAILVIGALAAGAYWYFMMRKSDEKVARPGGREGRQAADSGAELIEHPQYLDLGSFTVNLAEGRRFLKTTIQLLVSDEKANEYLKTRIVEVKDLVVGELQQQTADSLKDPRERELLKQRILTKVQTLLPVPPKEWKDPMPVKKLLITEFLVQ